MGWLREGKCYRAPVRWYPGGPVSQIEYYFAKPHARWYEGRHMFFPIMFTRGETNSGVGELTGQSVRRFWSGKLEHTPPGLRHVGTEDDFRGRTPYPGPTFPHQLPDCDGYDSGSVIDDQEVDYGSYSDYDSATYGSSYYDGSSYGTTGYEYGTYPENYGSASDYGTASSYPYGSAEYGTASVDYGSGPGSGYGYGSVEYGSSGSGVEYGSFSGEEVYGSGYGSEGGGDIVTDCDHALSLPPTLLVDMFWDGQEVLDVPITNGGSGTDHWWMGTTWFPLGPHETIVQVQFRCDPSITTWRCKLWIYDDRVSSTGSQDSYAVITYHEGPIVFTVDGWSFTNAAHLPATLNLQIRKP